MGMSMHCVYLRIRLVTLLFDPFFHTLSYIFCIDPGQFGMKFSSHGGAGTGVPLRRSELSAFLMTTTV